MAFDFTRGAFSAVALASILSTSAAWAGPTASDRETARMYMAEGRAKRDANDLKASLRAFEAADAIMHVPTTSLEVARTQAMLGLLVEARDRALQVARSSPRPGEPTPFVEARAAAEKLAADLEARIPSIRVTVVHPPPGLTVSIDGAALPAIAIGLGRKLDPGNHVIVARAAGTSRTIDVQVLERESKEVPIDLGVPETSPAAEPTNAGVSAPPTSSERARPSRGPWLGLGIVGLSLGGVGVVLGAVTGAMSISQTNAIKSQCLAGVCPAKLSDGSDAATALSNARTLAALSDVGFIAGGVLAAAGIALVVVGSVHSRGGTMAVTFGPRGVALGGTF